MHYLYTPITINENSFLVKVVIEEYGTENKKRGYNAQRINMSALQAAQFSKLIRKSRKAGSSETDGISVANLYSLVKTYDKDFVPGKPVNPALFNVDGTPRVFYHGTANQFDTFNMNPGAYGEGAYFTTSIVEAADYAIASLEAAGIEVPADYDDIEDWKLEKHRTPQQL